MLRQGKRGAGLSSIERGHPARFRAYGAVCWWNAMAVTLVATKASAVLDQFGNACNATQATDAARAVYAETGWNSRPCLNWGTTGTVGYVSPSVALGAQTVIAVVQSPATSSYAVVHVNDGTTGYLYTRGSHASRMARAGVTSDKDASVNWASDNVKRSIALTYNGTHATHRIYSGGVDINAASGSLTGNPGVGTVSGPLYLGCQQTIAASLKDFWAETIVYSSALPAPIMKRIANRHRALFGTA